MGRAYGRGMIVAIGPRGVRRRSCQKMSVMPWSETGQAYGYSEVEWPTDLRSGCSRRQEMQDCLLQAVDCSSR